MKTPITQLLLAAATVLALSNFAVAADQEVTIAFQTDVDPAKVAQADGEYEKATGWKINWRQFNSGSEVFAALASGDVQIGYTGSSPLAAAASREVPFQTILVADLIGEAEALVVRNGSGIKTPADLVGKKVAVPFVSTTHYSLLAALKHWSIDPKQVQILNLQPPEITAAWQRGDIDAAYVWDPALGKVKETGTVLVTSAEVGKWGAPTFDAWVARKDFTAAHPDFVKIFVQVTLDGYAAYRKNPAAFTAKSAESKKIAKLSGAKIEDVPELLKTYTFPVASEQAELLATHTVAAIRATAAFLKEQNKIEQVLPDYAPYVNARFVKQVTGS